MTDSSATSFTSRVSFAPSWLLRTSNHSPTPPLRALPNPGYKERTQTEDWDRSAGNNKQSNQTNGFRVQWNNGDNHVSSNSENYFNSNGNSHSRISTYDPDSLLRRSNSISTTLRTGSNAFPGRNNNNYQNLYGRSKYDSHFRQGSTVPNGFAFRDSHTNSDGISYSFVATKSLKPSDSPTSPVLQQSDFPSLNPMKAESSTKSAQNTVWGNPPHLAKVMKRSLSSQAYLEGGGTILGPHYGKGFLNGVMSRENKDDISDDLNTNGENGSSSDEYGGSIAEKSDGAESSSSVLDDHPHTDGILVDNSVDQNADHNSTMEEESCDWHVTEGVREEQHVPSSLLSSSGSTGSVESIDSHQYHLSGTTAMVEDLLDETITEEEKLQILHALEEIKERTGYGSYYERVALTENGHRIRRYPFLSEGKEEDEEDPDDRFLK